MWPPVVAVDAGPMQIQLCEGAILSRAETVLQGTTHDTVHAEIGYGKKVSRRLWLKKLEEEIGLTARHRDTERRKGRGFLGWEREVSARNADRWWGRKLRFGTGGPSDDFHDATQFSAAP